eukprot:1153561-Pleurochrysis_carterae.AAC.2
MIDALKRRCRLRANVRSAFRRRHRAVGSCAISGIGLRCRRSRVRIVNDDGHRHVVTCRGRGCRSFVRAVRTVRACGCVATADGGPVIKMHGEWFGKHLIGVSLTVALILGRLELFHTPAFALLGRGVTIDVSLAAVLGLYRVFVIAEHLPSGLGVNVADQYCAVVIQRMRLSSVVPLVIVGLGIVSQLGPGGPGVGTIA